ncbi:hypothetical protein WJX73_009399 [Symbiochloris irregularis]|uniref:Uncharacterized protein n=1 Tax=Symbiochloris irregularis TaxID=706552 RepID=A0AAW1P4L5_9CHLO
MAPLRQTAGPSALKGSKVWPVQAPGSMAEEYASVEKSTAGYAVVTFAREPANVMDLGFWQRLTTILDDVESDAAVRGVIFHSGLRRNIFTAGNDIKELYAPKTSRQRYAKFWTLSNHALARLYSSRLVTVAAVKGACPAGGCCLALCCDVRLMARDSGYIGLNEVALGIAVPKFWARLMTRLIGQGKADRLMLSAHMPSPSEALSVGLVDELVDSSQLMDTAVARMSQMLALPDDGRINTKQSQRSSFSHEWTECAIQEAQEMFNLLELPSTLRGLEAVMQKLAGKKAAKL